MWWYPGAGGWLAMLVGMILFALAGVAVVWAIIRVAGRPEAPRQDASLQILRERFARGEISQAEFEEAKRILGL